jgi:hypothetical protein
MIAPESARPSGNDEALPPPYSVPSRSWLPLPAASATMMPSAVAAATAS